jgi:Bardet-Biedl syndrome 4 protein
LAFLFQAKNYFKEAINISKHELSFHMLAKIFIKENNPQAAIETLTKAVEFNAESCELLTLLGLLYMRVRLQFDKQLGKKNFLKPF